MAVKLVALDIDGTIVPAGQDYPSSRLTEAVARLREKGIVVVLASGRMFPGTAAVARHLGLSEPVICQQGCSIHTLDGATLHEFPIERSAALDIVTYARDLDHPYEWFNPVRYLCSRQSPSAGEYARLSGIAAEYMDHPEHSNVVPTGVGIISSDSEAPGVHRALLDLHAESLHLLDFPAVTVAVARDANKGHALSLICNDLGIARSDVLSIGDSVNDAAMLEWAGHGVALAHSDRYALNAADEVLDPGGPDPVAALLEQL